MKKFMITGANFRNKGAQAMLFITISELRHRYPGCKIYFASQEDIDTQEYKFDTLRYTFRLKKIALGGMSGVKELFVSILADIIKVIIRYHGSRGQYFRLKKVLPQIDLIIDISGFSLGDKWNKPGQEEYLDNIRLAKKYHVKMVLMPQSFGPFNYSKDMQILHTEIKELLKYPSIIFAREREGEVLLKKQYLLKNVRKSPDIVLQNKEIDYSEIFRNPPELKIPNDIDSNAVAIVPNVKCFQHGNEKEIVSLYEAIVKILLENSKKIYIFRHSREDLSACKTIKALFSENESVYLLENDFSCMEFDTVIKQFQFSIISRFHGVVHSYKNCIPCIVLGWAVKYKALAKYMNQEEFSFDITEGKMDVKGILQHIEKMVNTYQNEKVKINECLKTIQQSNCFNVLEEILNE